MVFEIEKKSKIPYFNITGRLDSTVCCIQKPISGYVIQNRAFILLLEDRRNYKTNFTFFYFLMLNKKLTVNECNAPIKSIELQLVRVETCGCAEGYSKDCKIHFIT